MSKIKFQAIIEQHQSIDAAFIKIPFDVKEVFGTKGQVKVKVRFDGKVDYRGSIANMGMDCHSLGITKEIRNKINKTFGDPVSVELEKDIEERIVIIQTDVSGLLDINPKAKEYFNSLSYTDRKEYIQWIEEAKKEETRVKRIEKFIEKLNNRKKFSDK